MLHTLEAHKEVLQGRIDRLNRLVNNVDTTILHMKGILEMKQKDLFTGFTDEKQKEYGQEIRRCYGDDSVKESNKRWNSSTPAEKERIKAESEAIYRELLAHMDKGYDSAEVQACVSRWHQHLRYLYELSDERLLGLAELYNEHPAFLRTFQNMDSDLPKFLKKAIGFYI